MDRGLDSRHWAWALGSGNLPSVSSLNELGYEDAGYKHGTASSGAFPFAKVT